MRGLRKNQELVESIYTQSADQFQTNGQAYPAQIVHRLVEREAAGVAKGTVCAPELVFDNIARVALQHPPRFLLLLDHAANHVHQLIEELLLGASQRRLV